MIIHKINDLKFLKNLFLHPGFVFKNFVFL